MIVMNAIHEILGRKHLEGCNNAEGPCLQALIKEYITKKNGMDIVDGMALLLPALYVKPNTLAKWFTDISKVIQHAFPGSDIAQAAREKLHVAREVALQRRKEYERKVFKVNSVQRQLLDSDVILTINHLKDSKDWKDLSACVSLAVGSRLSEIMQVSHYERATERNWIRIEGVSKDKLADLKEGNQRIFVKPIVGGLSSDDIISMVGEIRSQVSEQYDVDLGTGHGSRHLTRRAITALVNNQLNKKAREIFKADYVFHDLRSIYAAMAYAQFAPNGMSQTAFFAQVLGHREESLTTALSYQKFSIKRKLKEDPAELIARITTMEAQFYAFQEKAKDKENKYPNLEEMNGPASREVSLMNVEGKTATFVKQPHYRDGDEGARMDRLNSMVEKLLDAKIKPTYAILRRLGFGGRSITKLKKARKQQVEATQPDVRVQ